MLPNSRKWCWCWFAVFAIIVAIGGVDAMSIDLDDRIDARHATVSELTAYNLLPRNNLGPDAGAVLDPNIEEQGGDWLQSIKRLLKGSAGQLVVNLAKEIVSRQVGGTQVLSLNLTNLLILLFLKAIVFAAALIGAGSWGQYGRSLTGRFCRGGGHGPATRCL